jgi:hypothetical protein
MGASALDSLHIVINRLFALAEHHHESHATLFIIANEFFICLFLTIAFTNVHQILHVDHGTTASTHICIDVVVLISLEGSTIVGYCLEVVLKAAINWVALDIVSGLERL